jgi:hypothetical protein
VKQHWTLPGIPWASSSISLERVHSELHRPSSLAFFCPERGEIWGRRAVELSDGSLARWQIYQFPSEGAHAPHYDVAGTVLFPVHWFGDLTEVPWEVLAREFMLLYNGQITNC